MLSEILKFLRFSSPTSYCFYHVKVLSGAMQFPLKLWFHIVSVIVGIFQMYKVTLPWYCFLRVYVETTPARRVTRKKMVPFVKLKRRDTINFHWVVSPFSKNKSKKQMNARVCTYVCARMKSYMIKVSRQL